MERKQSEEAAFRAYIGTGLQYLTEYTAGLAGGKHALKPYADVFINPQTPKEKEKNGDEIAAELILKFGLKVKNDESI